jgi:hypothetical protein
MATVSPFQGDLLIPFIGTNRLSECIDLKKAVDPAVTEEILDDIKCM